MSTDLKIEKNKYWIKEGLPVSHVDYPNIKMTVEKIVKQVRDVVIGEKTKKVPFVIGVRCYWIDDEKVPHKVVFNTRSLKPREI
jgi:hypothetical protein